jgi:pseudaminic acid synthase
VAKDIQKGDVFTEENIRSVRPGYGLHPKYLKDILGKQASEDIPFASALAWDKINMV